MENNNEKMINQAEITIVNQKVEKIPAKTEIV
jgi:hypothetical protein